MARATATTRTLANAAGDLRAYWSDLTSRALPPGVAYYSLGDVTRDEDDQERELAEGSSAAGWGDSPHNYVPSAAIDVYPIVYDRPGSEGAAAVSTDPADYEQIGDVAAEHGLRWGGTWSSPDRPHVELRGWRDRVASPMASLAGGGTVSLLAVALVAGVVLARRSGLL